MPVIFAEKLSEKCVFLFSPCSPAQSFFLLGALPSFLWVPLADCTFPVLPASRTALTNGLRHHMIVLPDHVLLSSYSPKTIPFVLHRYTVRCDPRPRSPLMNRLSSVHRGSATPTRSPSDTVSLCRTSEIRFHRGLLCPLYPLRPLPGDARNNRITTLFSGISGISDSLVSGISVPYVGCVRCVSHVRFVRLVRYVCYRCCSTGTQPPALPAFSVTFLSPISPIKAVRLVLHPRAL